MRRLKLVSYIFSPVVVALFAGVLLAELGIGSRSLWSIVILSGLCISIVNSVIVVISIAKK